MACALSTVQLLIELLLPPFEHPTFVHQDAPILIPVHLDSQYKAIAECVKLLVRLRVPDACKSSIIIGSKITFEDMFVILPVIHCI